jgi:acyl dehydratase
MFSSAAVPLAADRLLAMPASVQSAIWTARDTALYNLGIGFGAAAIHDPALLPFVLEESPRAFPTMATVMVRDTGWFTDPALGIDFPNMLHGEQWIEMIGPMPAEGPFTATDKVDAIWDKGPGRPALIATSRELANRDGELFARCGALLMIRNSGGFGGSAEGAPTPVALPNRAPTGSISMPTHPEQALWYRLSGDLNPLHSDPVTARAAGFPQPILMGLCSFGIAGRGLVAALADGDATRLRRLAVRFSNIVFPGETIRIDYWLGDDGEVLFRGVVDGRGPVLDGGSACLA